MHHESLARVFRRIVLLSLPGSAIALGTACSGTVRDSSSTNMPPGAGGSTAAGGATNAQMDAGGGNSGTQPIGSGSGGTLLYGGPAVDSCGDPQPPPNTFPRCTPSCIPLDGIVLPPTDASPPMYIRDECTPLCGSSGWFSCGPVTVNGVRMLRCNVDCTGRRPPGFLPSLAATGLELGAYFAEMAELEAASIEAFRLLRNELAHHRAPRALVRSAERAIRDEIHHTRLTQALARRYGGEFRAPIVEKMPLRSLEAIATDNAVEGCVRETFGALVATYQSRAAIDPSIRSVMKRIARDETRHATLAYDVDRWVRGRIDRSARARVEAARRTATQALLAREDDTSFAERRILGLPTRSEERDLLRAMTAALAA